MDTKSLAQPTTRFTRGIALGIARFEQIERTAPWRWSVPSESDVERVYVVDLKTATCPCAENIGALGSSVNRGNPLSTGHKHQQAWQVGTIRPRVA